MEKRLHGSIFICFESDRQRCQFKPTLELPLALENRTVYYIYLSISPYHGPPVGYTLSLTTPILAHLLVIHSALLPLSWPTCW